ncbi:MAG: gamma-glutamyl-gamma-aminobutyrate hydrolase family protein, partial [Sphingorhabdus sp.]
VELIAHHAPEGIDFDAMFNHRHPVALIDGGILASAYAKPVIDVNSVHYQGIGRLAEGLFAEAYSPDGLIEAFSARPNGAPLLAVQWHPEWDTATNPGSQIYFQLLGKALRGEM